MTIFRFPQYLAMEHLIRGGYTTRINIQTFLVVLTNWMKVLIFIHRKRLGLYPNDFGIDILKFSTYVPRFCTTFT